MSNNRNEQILGEIIATARKCNFCSPDVSDVHKFQLARSLEKIPFRPLRRVVNYPFRYLKRYHPQVIRKFVQSGYVYPQGQAVFIRGQIQLIRRGSPWGDLTLCKEIARWLLENRSPNMKNYCWGQPFLWYSRKPFPPNLPRTTVSSQVAWAFLDLFELTGDQQYLDVAESVCRFYLEDLSHEPDENGNWCFSYTTIDQYHIHNASLLAASALMRVASLANDPGGRYREASLKAVRFSLHHQNEDGSWYYWAPPDKLSYKIDNYHTGFNLEALATILDDHPDADISEAYEKGLEYFAAKLFQDDVPKHTDKLVYPIDIQACGQAIITFALAASSDQKYADRAKAIAGYTIDNMYCENKRHFAYRIYENQFRDNSYYFRWGDAWMIRALSLIP